MIEEEEEFCRLLHLEVLFLLLSLASGSLRSLDVKGRRLVDEPWGSSVELWDCSLCTR